MDLPSFTTCSVTHIESKGRKSFEIGNEKRQVRVRDVKETAIFMIVAAEGLEKQTRRLAWTFALQ